MTQQQIINAIKSAKTLSEALAIIDALPDDTPEEQLAVYTMASFKHDPKYGELK